MERVKGLEPSLFLVGSQVPYQLGDTLSNLAGRPGLDPGTGRFGGGCSAVELSTRIPVRGRRALRRLVLSPSASFGAASMNQAPGFPNADPLQPPLRMSVRHSLTAPRELWSEYADSNCDLDPGKVRSYRWTTPAHSWTGRSESNGSPDALQASAWPPCPARSRIIVEHQFSLAYAAGTVTYGPRRHST